MIKISIDTQEIKGRIRRHIYGHFVEHVGRGVYGGIWVGKDSTVPNIRGIRQDIIDALKQIRVPVIRWPGGCFADQYHWRDGVGPYQERPSRINSSWGNVVEPNYFGTHEYFDLCESIGADPYIVINVGSGSVREFREWIEYITGNKKSSLAVLREKHGRKDPWELKYVGIGNESWGCGGHMRAHYYADIFRHYATYAQDCNGNRLYTIACGPVEDDYQWTEVIMSECRHFLNAISLHYYTIPGNWDHKGSSTQFDEFEWFTTMKKALHLKNIIENHSKIMDKYDPDKRVGIVVDEWGTWYDPEPGSQPWELYQQNTLRDALVAGITLNILNNHSQRVHMANIAQLVNVLQALILTRDDKMVLTPTYHVFDMYKVHHDADLLDIVCESDVYAYNGDQIPQIIGSASKDDRGRVHISLCNVHPRNAPKVICQIRGTKVHGVSAVILTAGEMNARNTFDQPYQVLPRVYDQITLANNMLEFVMPSKSVLVLSLRIFPIASSEALSRV